MTTAAANTPGLLTYEDLSRISGFGVSTLRSYASTKRPLSKRLRVIRITHRTVRIRPSDWDLFIAACEPSRSYERRTAR